MLKKLSNYFPKHKKSDLEKKYKVGKTLGSYAPFGQPYDRWQRTGH